MNFKTTLILLVLAAAAAGLYLILGSLGPTMSAPGDADLPVTLVEGRRFDRITIERGEDLYELTREDNGRWWQTRPVRFPVNPQAVEAIVNAGLSLSPRQEVQPLENATVEGEASQAATAPPLGLDPPLATVAFESDVGTYALQLGHTSVAGTGYLKLAGEPEVYLVDDALHTAALEVDPRQWRPEQLPALDAEQITRIDLTRGKRTLTLRRTADGWALSSGDGAAGTSETSVGGDRAQAEQALKLAQIAQQAQPTRYIGDDSADLSRYGLEPATAMLRVADAVGRQRTLRFGSAADLQNQTVYATWSDTDESSPVVFTLPMPYADVTRLEPDQLRDRRLVTSPVESVRGLRVSRVGRDNLEVQLGEDGRYEFVEPEPNYAPDPQLLPQWVATLHRVEPAGFARAPREAQAPLAIVELILAGDRSEHVRLYADRDGREDMLLAVREKEETALVVPRDQLAPLLAPVVTLRDRSLPAIGPIDTVRLQRDDGHEFVFNRGEQSWSLEGVDGGEWEAKDFDRLLSWLRMPQVASWTAMPDLPRGPIARVSTGQDRPAYVINVDQNLGQRTDLPGVFKLPEDIAPRFAAEYRDRLVLPVRADEIRQVVVTRQPGDAAEGETQTQAASATLTRGGGGVLQVDGQPAADPAAAAGLLDTLAGLQAKRYRPAPPADAAATPQWSFNLTTVDGREFELQRFANGLWQLGDRYFFVDETIDAKLTQSAAISTPAP